MDIQNRLRLMTAEMDTPPAQIDTRRLLPVFAPAEFFTTGTWCGPHTKLRAPSLGLTWAVLMPYAVMQYVNRQMQEHWDAQRLDWKRLAMSNLTRQTNDHPGARTLCRPGGKVYAIAFMFQDGLGTSRLLLRDGLGKMFPQGYRVALPERSAGFAFAADLTPEESRTVMRTVKECFRQGTNPLVADTFAADDLLPDE
jgi:hypothetical protein